MAVILVVENEAALRQTITIALRREGHQVLEAPGKAAALHAAQADVLDAALVDLRLDDGDGLDVLRALCAEAPDVGVVMMTAFGTIELAVEAVRLGAYDFLQKPFGPERLLASMGRALEHRRLRAELKRRSVADRSDGLVGTSAAIEAVRRKLRPAAAARVALVTGETGTGKELVARAIHDAADDPAAPFVVVNCGALPESLIESELFGHVKGAFSGATHPRRGLLAEAEGGTLFLDEIGEVPLQLQPRLLRFLESGEVRPVGADHTATVSCRVVAATNRDLPREVKEGRLRQDLFYRLDLFRLPVPPLRDRPGDLAPLSEHLLARAARHLRRPPPRLADGALEAMAAYGWPGNVRELLHTLERAMLLCEGDELPVELLVPAVEEPAEALPAEAPGALPTLASVERRHILGVLEKLGGDRDRAASTLGISRSTLRRKLIEYGAWPSGRTGAA